MANKALIRKLHFKDGRSIRQLAKDIGYSRQTIRKALENSEISTRVFLPIAPKRWNKQNYSFSGM